MYGVALEPPEPRRPGLTVVFKSYVIGSGLQKYKPIKSIGLLLIESMFLKMSAVFLLK